MSNLGAADNCWMVWLAICVSCEANLIVCKGECAVSCVGASWCEKGAKVVAGSSPGMTAWIGNNPRTDAYGHSMWLWDMDHCVSDCTRSYHLIGCGINRRVRSVRL